MHINPLCENGQLGTRQKIGGWLAAAGLRALESAGWLAEERRRGGGNREKEKKRVRRSKEGERPVSFWAGIHNAADESCLVDTYRVRAPTHLILMRSAIMGDYSKMDTVLIG